MTLIIDSFESWKAFEKAFGKLKKISKKVLDKKYDL